MPLPNQTRAPAHGLPPGEGEPVIWTACLLLPVMAVLLYTTSRIEEWLTRTTQPPRHARRRHLRLVPGGRQAASPLRTPGWRHRRLDAA